jgi:hypothetical protein
MNKKQLLKLEAMSMIGKDINFRDKKTGIAEPWGVVKDEVYILVGDYKHMIQRIRFHEGKGWGGNRYAYRTGYYTFDKKMQRIVWGQFTQFLTQSEYKELLSKAKEKGWPIF